MTTAPVMEPCPDYYSGSATLRSNRPCRRPAGHLDDHGPLTINRIKYQHPRPVDEFLGEPGWEINGALLPERVLDAIATSRTYRKPCEFVVTGEMRREDGARFLTFAVPADYIESVSNYRAEPDGRMRLLCPECGLKDGSHSRTCERR